MTKNIVIPINNKGGVGKTSILADLSAALAQRFKVGIIDFDDQASLVGTLTGEDLACRSLDESDLKVRHSILTPSTRFMFQDNFGRLIIDVNETTAKLVAFPPGMLYDHPEKRQRLEEIVCREMAEETFLMIDLPPIPHPGMILDYTIMPIVESLGRDVRIFPLLVATPDHNVIEIGLRGFSKVAKYLKEKDIPEDVIHPLFVINKVPITDNERLGITFDPKVSLKLSRLGALYLSELTDASTINHINHHFDYEGRRFRSVVFPELSSIKDGKFSLFQGHTLQLQQYPHLVEMAKSHHYNFPNENDPQTRVYTFSLQQMVNFIKAQAAERPLHNYVKRRIVTPISKLKSDSISALRRAIENYYNTGEVVYTDIVTKSKIKLGLE